MKRKQIVIIGSVIGLLLCAGQLVAGYGPDPVGYVQVAEGDVVAINSDVAVIRANNQEECRTLGRGGAVYSEDIIITGEGGKLQIMFLDGSLLVVGETTQIKVGAFEYSYNDSSQNRQEVTLVSGQCRFASGRVVHSNPDGFVLGTTNMDVELHGTEVGLVVTTQGSLLGDFAAQLASYFANTEDMTQEEREAARQYLEGILNSVLNMASLQDVLESSVIYFSSTGTGEDITVTLYNEDGGVLGQFVIQEDQVLVVGPNGETSVVHLDLGLLNQFTSFMIDRMATTPAPLRATQGQGGNTNGGNDGGSTTGGDSGSSGNSGGSGSSGEEPEGSGGYGGMVGNPD